MEQRSVFYQRSREELWRIIESSRAHGCTRAVLVTTRDREHAVHVVRQVAVEAGRPVYHYSAAGRRRWRDDRLAYEPCGGPCHDPSELLRQAHELREGGVVLVEDVMSFLREQGGDRGARAQFMEMLAAESRSAGVVMVFVEPPEAEGYVPSVVADQVVRFDVPMPRKDELEGLARDEVTAAAFATGRPLGVDTVQRWSGLLANEVVGLARTAARDALRDALSADPTALANARALLAARKSGHLSRELAMRVLESGRARELPVGLDNVYRYIETNRERVLVTGPDRARGILLLGVPGTGKSMLAQGIGQLLDLPVIQFQIGALMNSLLGETERRFDQAFQVLEAMSPSCVHIDEIEKAFGDSSGTERDGGTMVRCTGRLLSWLADNPHPNYIVATANSLRRLGTELGQTLTRRGRFDRVFFVDVPVAAARQQMLAHWLAPHMADAAAAAAALAGSTERFSGADLRAAVNDAVAGARYQKRDVSVDDLLHEIEHSRLRVQALYDEFEELRRFARLYCEPAGPTDGTTK